MVIEFVESDVRAELPDGKSRILLPEEAFGPNRNLPNGVWTYRYKPLVYSREESAQEPVARFLEELPLDSVVLHEKLHDGRSFVGESFDHADIDFARVLLTLGDAGGPVENRDGRSRLARQNPIFDSGSFAEMLGPVQGCAFTEGAVETPSDYHGFVSIGMDYAGDSQTKIFQELKAAGLAIDANRAFE